VEIVAFSNRDPVKAAEITRKFGLTRLYADYREMFDAEKPDFVDVITPPPSHQSICAEAAQRGIHIICQKALAPTFEEAKAIVAHAAAATVRFMVHENFRFQPWHREIRRQIEAKRLAPVFGWPSVRAWATARTPTFPTALLPRISAPARLRERCSLH
jgi:predicted dehydrogenase